MGGYYGYGCQVWGCYWLWGYKAQGREGKMQNTRWHPPPLQQRDVCRTNPPLCQQENISSWQQKKGGVGWGGLTVFYSMLSKRRMHFSSAKNKTIEIADCETLRGLGTFLQPCGFFFLGGGGGITVISLRLPSDCRHARCCIFKHRIHRFPSVCFPEGEPG